VYYLTVMSSGLMLIVVPDAVLRGHTSQLAWLLVLALVLLGMGAAIVGVVQMHAN